MDTENTTHIRKIKHFMCKKNQQKKQTSYRSRKETFRRDEPADGQDRWKPSAERPEPSHTFLVELGRWATTLTEQMHADRQKEEIRLQFHSRIWKENATLLQSLRVNLIYRPWSSFLLLHKPGHLLVSVNKTSSRPLPWIAVIHPISALFLVWQYYTRKLN